MLFRYLNRCNIPPNKAFCYNISKHELNSQHKVGSLAYEMPRKSNVFSGHGHMNAGSANGQEWFSQNRKMKGHSSCFRLCRKMRPPPNPSKGNPVMAFPAACC